MLNEVTRHRLMLEGARARTRELGAEISDLIQSFPELATELKQIVRASARLGGKYAKGAGLDTGKLVSQLEKVRKGRKPVTPAFRKKMAESMRQRWAKSRKEGKTIGGKPLRSMSAEGRKNIAEARRARAVREKAAKAGKADGKATVTNITSAQKAS